MLAGIRQGDQRIFGNSKPYAKRVAREGEWIFEKIHVLRCGRFYRRTLGGKNARLGRASL